MKGKGRMTDNLGHDDRAYHEYLQQQVYAEDLGLNFPQSHSHPSLRISEPDLNVTPILTSQSENMPDLGHDGDEPDPNPHQDFDFYPQMEEKLPKQVKSDLFVLHMKKVMHEDGSTVVIYNYCKKAAYCKQNGKRAIRFPRDVPTHWNSTYKLLARSYEYRDLLVTFIQYHKTPKIKKFDILHWWKEHERYFPILAMIAKQILSTPVSTVAVEQQFSSGGNILDPKRSLMNPKSLQIQACVEDWTKAQYRQQEIDQEEPYDFFKDDQPAESRTDEHGND
ncbi:hypothetical protein Dsin_013670 [Dipteronia sinensis]|uniref:HAT C-terminal dimerisation domain-containing protein n=1 Tax=Dipteronia sinensis TaxID=43782 RepID=A0AAE0EAT5_9ROSI|nr:hypothetical protein Dsin_013670 [Dipteronia sinensis]